MSITAIGGISAASLTGTSPAFLASPGNTTSFTQLADGATVTTVRDKQSEIVSISTTPPAIYSAPLAFDRLSAGGRIDLSA